MNVPLLCIPAAYLLTYAPLFFRTAQLAKLPEGYDNSEPRIQQLKATGLAARASGAHNNGFEASAPFGLAVIAAQVTHPATALVTQLSLAFLALRVVYTGLYLGNISTLRSVVWTLAFLCTLGIFWVAIQ